MTGPANGLMGEDFGTDIPELQVPEQDLTEEKNMARFSKSAEFKKLQLYLESRIDFYQNYLPDGRSIKSQLPTPEQWAIANAIIGEFKSVISQYEEAKVAVDNALQRKGA